jgi:predicted amidohydrolase
MAILSKSGNEIRLLALGLSLFAAPEPSAVADPPAATALPSPTIAEDNGGKAGPSFYYERFFPFFPALAISANGASVSLIALAWSFLSDGMSGN